MNTLVHAGALFALLWLSLSYAFGTLANDILGFSILGVAVIWFLLLIEAVVEDFRRFRGAA